MTAKSKPTFIGRYILHDLCFHVYYDATRTSGAEVAYAWTPHGYITMTIGGREKCWQQVYAAALHEVMEASFIAVHASFEPFSGLRRIDSGRFRFMLNHDQFTLACIHAGDMMSLMAPELEKAWKKGRK